MAITTLDQLVDALANSSQTTPMNKASLANMTAGTLASLWRATGTPGQGAQPTTATVCNSLTPGAMAFTHPGGALVCYVGRSFAVSSNSGTDVQFRDRLAHRAGLVGNVTTAQTVDVDITGTSDNMAERRGSADYSDVEWFLEIQADIGTTATTCTVTYTTGDGTPGQTFPVTVGATTNSQNRAGRLFPLLTPTPIRSVESVQLTATTGTAGNFAIVATRLLLTHSLGLANSGIVYDWSMTGLPRVPAEACIYPVLVCGTTSTGTLIGNLRIVAG